MPLITPVAGVPRLPDRPVARVAGSGRADASRPRAGDAGMDAEVALRGPVAGLSDVAAALRTAGFGVGRGAYAAAAYRAAEALRPGPAPDGVVEVSARPALGGGRVTVARRVAGDRTLAIEARVG